MPDPSEKSTPSRVLDTPKAAIYCGSSASTFEKLRLTGGGPRYIKITTRRVGYLRDDLDTWLLSKARLSSTSQEMVEAKSGIRQSSTRSGAGGDQ